MIDFDLGYNNADIKINELSQINIFVGGNNFLSLEVKTMVIVYGFNN